MKNNATEEIADITAKRKNKRILVLISILLIVCIGAGVGLFFLFRGTEMQYTVSFSDSTLNGTASVQYPNNLSAVNIPAKTFKDKGNYTVDLTASPFIGLFEKSTGKSVVGVKIVGDSNDTVYTTGETIAVTKNIELSFVFADTANSVTICFNDANDNPTESTFLGKGTNINVSNVNKTYFTLKGYSTDNYEWDNMSLGTTLPLYSSSQLNAKQVSASDVDVTFFAIWEPITVNFIYDKNNIDATGEAFGTTSVKYGTASENFAFASKGTLSLSYNTCLGWSKNSSDSTAAFTFGSQQAIDNSMMEGATYTLGNDFANITLYAIWEQNTTQLSLNLNDGVYGGANSILTAITFNEGQIISAESLNSVLSSSFAGGIDYAKLTKDNGHMMFVGWAASNTGAVITASWQPIGETVVLYARYTTIFSISGTASNASVLGIKTDAILPANLVIPEIAYSLLPDGSYTNYSIKSISAGAFVNKKALTSVTISNTLTSLASGIFADCTNLEFISLPAVINNIGYIFLNSSNWNLPTKLTTVEINGGTSLERDFFNYCLNLTSVVIADSVKIIGDSAFFHCENITSITLPNSIESINSNAFAYCLSLTTFGTALNNGFYVISADGKILLQKSDGSVIAAALSGVANYEVDEEISGITVIAIGSYAFRGFNELCSLVLPKTLLSVGSSIFADCTNLTSIALPIMGANFGVCFGGTVPASITHLTINGGTQITAWYFSSHGENLQEVTVGDSIIEIAGGAFWACYSLKSLIICRTEEQGITVLLNDNAFGNGAVDNEDFTIYVPANSLNAYQEAAMWILLADKIVAL